MAWLSMYQSGSNNMPNDTTALLILYPYLLSHSRLGIEGLVMFKGESRFDTDNYTITVPSPSSTNVTTIAIFDRVTVNIEVEKDKNTQRGRVKMTLISPVDSRSL